MLNCELTDFLKKTASQIGIELSDEQVKQFSVYGKLLLEWNKFMNLTAVCEEKEVIIKHFVDSMTIVKYVDNHNCKKIADIGTGAGFPGIPLKIIRPDVEVVLLDSLGKRVNFLNTVINELNLEKISAIHTRAEDGGRDKKLREKFDCATARAVAPMNILLEYCMPFVKKGGCFIAMKGATEDDSYENALIELSGKVESENVFTLPESDFARRILGVKKIENLSTRYPRKAGIPKKNPL